MASGKDEKEASRSLDLSDMSASSENESKQRSNPPRTGLCSRGYSGRGAGSRMRGGKNNSRPKSQIKQSTMSRDDASNSSDDDSDPEVQFTGKRTKSVRGKTTKADAVGKARKVHKGAVQKEQVRDLSETSGDSDSSDDDIPLMALRKEVKELHLSSSIGHNIGKNYWETE